MAASLGRTRQIDERRYAQKFVIGHKKLPFCLKGSKQKP